MFDTLLKAVAEIEIMTAWELLAVVLAIAYLWLAMKANKLCWLAAFVSTAIYTVLFWHVSLLMESVLNIYYMAMAVYGFWMWTNTNSHNNETHHRANSALPIVSWSLQKHGMIIAMTSLVSLIVGYLMSQYTQASFAYLDAATTCFAVMTTYLVAKKVLENWLYWVVIDAVSIYLYFQKGLMLTTVLFVGYVFMAAFGYLMWKKRITDTNSMTLQVQ
ncbi:nicotinamide riboside transporter PnuC [Shewanella intestini]|uniref:Nicotinamide riboside transporter PnuC n=1 Tax=Shewanella intestini TaxID=2017544 RepID=A0ABS5I4R7_9GAMM|nr:MULTISPECIES: nicotinamide riboside transporter PnuC [Shewanella]MBR9729027.1 nicotinamide mononucleotide transporter [Shewanella intestini]MRG36907.1 nicotinamide riboside transporter PnuC [Shewanella sp. XMDDZSB0408]